MRVLLDASALLAWLQDEPGSDVVEDYLSEAAVPATNWAEVLQKVDQHGRDASSVAGLIRGLGVTILDVTETDAEAAAGLWRIGPSLSLADRICLAMGVARQIRVLTADAAWADIDQAEVVVVRSS